MDSLVTEDGAIEEEEEEEAVGVDEADKADKVDKVDKLDEVIEIGEEIEVGEVDKVDVESMANVEEAAPLIHVTGNLLWGSPEWSWPRGVQMMKSGAFSCHHNHWVRDFFPFFRGRYGFLRRGASYTLSMIGSKRIAFKMSLTQTKSF
jgi:hypothetical protein